MADPTEAMWSDHEWAQAEYEGVWFAGCDKKLEVNDLRAAGDARAKYSLEMSNIFRCADRVFNCLLSCRVWGC